MDKRAKTTTLLASNSTDEQLKSAINSGRAVSEPLTKEKLSVDKEYLQYRLDELIKTNANVINEYSYLMSVLHPPLPLNKESIVKE